MLNAMRTGAGKGFIKFILFGLLTMATAGLVLMDVGGFFRGGIDGNQVLARVDNQDISLNEFYQSYQSLLTRQGISRDQAQQMNLAQVILQRELNQRIFVAAAQNSGIRVSDDVVAGFIKSQLDGLPIESSYKDKMDFLLRNVGMNEQSYVASLKRDVASDIYFQIFPSWSEAPDTLTDKVFKNAKEKRVVEVVTVDRETVLPFPQIDDDAIAAHYDNNSFSFVTPETRSFDVLIIDPDDVTKDIVVSDDDARRFYDNNSYDFALPPQVQLDQIIVPSQDDADKLIEAIQNNTSPFDVAVEGKRELKDLTVSIESLPGAVAELIETTSDNSWSETAAQTSLGFHVVRVQERLNDQMQSFDDVKNDIIIRLKDEQIDDRLFALAEELDTMAIESDSLDSIAEAYNAKVLSVKGLPQDGNDPQSGDNILAEFQNSQDILLGHAFTLYKDEISPLIETDNGGYALIQVTDISASKQKELAEVKANIIETLAVQKQNETLRQTANDVITAYKDSDNKNLQRLSEKMNLPYTRYNSLERPNVNNHSDAGSVESIIQTSAFQLEPQKHDITFASDNDGRIYVIRLVDIIEEKNISRGSADYQEVGKKIANDQFVELQQQISLYLNDKYNAEINQALFNRAFINRGEE